MPSPQSSRRRGGSNTDTIKKVMRGANVPDEYHDLYDSLSRDTGSLTVTQLKGLFEQSSVPLEVRDKILGLVAGRSRDEGTTVGKDAVIVFLALVGLAEEGEEDLGFDAVDDRKRSS